MKLNTLFVGNVAKHFTELDSTNRYAVELVAKTKPSEGTVITADFQGEGRGQIGRNWYSSKGSNLLLSLILYPRWLAAREQFALSQAMALAVADAVSECCQATAEVKWPNDIYLEGRKVAGILIQNSLAGTQLQWSVVGIGLNVNEKSFPDELPRALSLAQYLDQQLDLEQVKTLLLHKLEQRYLLLKSDAAQIRADYLQKLYQYQSWHTYRDLRQEQLFLAKIIGLEKTGKLTIQTESGSVKYFDLKEIEFI